MSSQFERILTVSGYGKAAEPVVVIDWWGASNYAK